MQPRILHVLVSLLGSLSQSLCPVPRTKLKCCLPDLHLISAYSYLPSACPTKSISNNRLGGAAPTDVQMFTTDTPDAVTYRDEGKTMATIIGSVMGGCAFLLSVVIAVDIVRSLRHRRQRHSVLGSAPSTADMRLI